MAKFDNDKYYTNPELSKQLIQKTIVVLQKENINFDELEVIEPAAGNGSFSNHIPNCKAFDLFPEHPSVIKQDFLKLDIPYKQNRLIISNPPFGVCSSKARTFIKKANQISQYYAFILPASFLINRMNLNIIYSEHLGNIIFDNGQGETKKVNCCFIIYKRISKIEYKRYKLEDLNIWELRKNIPYNPDYDFKMLNWNGGINIGRIWTQSDDYYHSKKLYLYIKVNNQSLKNRIYQALLDCKPNLIQPRINKGLYLSAPSIHTRELYQYLIETIPELK
ncbi:MAG: hypothetical protein PHN88_09255 [Ignavibacteria bacterium]|nr:hypothetical protein [Ignavibacteria bacterium]